MSEEKNEDRPEKGPVAEMLRSPSVFIQDLCGRAACGRRIAFLLAATAVGCGLAGLAAGFFVSGPVALLDAAKSVGIVLFSYVLCLPSLYVFACLSGTKLSFGRIAAFGLVCTATLGCVLAALAPIVWLFAVSTASCGFFLFLLIVFVGLALSFGGRPIAHARAAGVVTDKAGLGAWYAVFVVVLLQAITLMRPMLSEPSAEPQEPRKCFFLQHFAHTLFPPREDAPQDAEPSSVPRDPVVREAHEQAPAPARYITHTMAPGDDLTTLAILYGIPPAKIRELNDLPDTAELKPGMKVRVPKP